MFLGEVVKSELHSVVSVNPKLSPETRATWTAKYNRLTFAVTETFKGAATGEFEALNLAEIVTSCDEVTDIKSGQKWVVFAYQRDGKGEFYISPTSFLYDEAKEAEKLRYLHTAVANGETKVGIYGQFTANYPASRIKIEGFKVTAEGNSRQQLTAKMDKYGQYAFPAVFSGVFKIKIHLPFNGYLREGNHRTDFVFDKETGLYTYEYETLVKDNECAYERTHAFPADPKNGDDK